MSAAVPKPQEPSMDEILASIRRIISDDQESARVAAPVRPAPVAPGPLAQRPADAPFGPVAHASAPADGAASNARPEEASRAAEPTPAPASDGALDLSDFDAADLEEPSEPTAPPEPEPPAEKETTMDAQPRPAHADEPAPFPERAPRHADPVQAFEPHGSLEDHLISRATDQSVSHAFHLLTHTVLSHNARTLEDLVKDMLRPMLKGWLDENLPVIVERLVRAEIERVARGGR